VALIKEIRDEMVQQMQVHYNDIASGLAGFKLEQATAMVTFQGSVAGLSQDLSDVQMDIHSLRTTTQYMQANMEHFDSKVKDLHTGIDNLGSQVKEIQGDFEQLGPQAKEIQSVLDETKETLGMLAAFGSIVAYPKLSIVAAVGTTALWIANWKMAGYVTAIGSKLSLLILRSTLLTSRKRFVHTTL
jgi:uncharacterized protein YukE